MFTNEIDLEMKRQIDAEGAIFLEEPMTAYLSRSQFISAGKLHIIISKTPKDFLFEIMNPDQEQTRATIMGSAFHTYCLERAKFEREYAILIKRNLPFPDKDFRNGDNKAYRDKLIATAQIKGMAVVSEDDYGALEGMSDELNLNATAKNILSQQGVTEISIYTFVIWNEKKYYVKIRPDRVSLLKPFFIDIKKTRSASPEPNCFPKDAYVYGYDIKLALYMKVLQDNWDGLMEHCGITNYQPLRRALIIAVEEAPPYKNLVYNIPAAVFESGKYRYEAALNRFELCMSSQTWPGYEIMAEEGSQNIVDLILPKWSEKEIVI